MANVNLKTDFKDGEFLYADQLKNNFEAIQAALNAMNAIVWQDNADKVVTFRGTTEELMNRPIIDGQILYDTTTGESYIDYLGKRISTGSGNAIHIGDTEPTNPSTQIWIAKNELASVGSEVVNSLEGNEERMAPSVAAVNKKLQQDITVDGEITKTGRKIFGKDEYVYTKKINKIEGISTGLTNVDYVTDIKCMLLDTVNENGAWRPIPWCYNSNPYDSTYNAGIVFNPHTGGFAFQLGENISENAGKGIVSIYFTYKESEE